LEGTTKADVMRTVEVTVMVYRFMEEQHKLDSSLPKQPLILQDMKRLNEFALAYAVDSAYQNVIPRVGLPTYLR
jgi:hypothetical protein